MLNLCLSFIGGYFVYNILDSERQVIKQKFNEIVEQRFKMKSIKYTDYGFHCFVECLLDSNFTELESHKETFDKHFQAKTYLKNIKYSNLIEMDIVTKQKDLTQPKITLSPYQLLIGYNHIYQPIIIDMKITPHLGVVGISNNGKTKCIEQAFKNRNDIEIHILNSMSNDFKGIGTKRINGEYDILDYLYYIAHNEKVYTKPLYVILDEYNVISNLKGLDNILEDLLRQARHKNIFLIVLMQQATKEECNFKNLFNCRLCFKQIGSIQYYSFLGTTIDEIMLQQREFILLHTDIEYGKSYLINS